MSIFLVDWHFFWTGSIRYPIESKELGASGGELMSKWFLGYSFSGVLKGKLWRGFCGVVRDVSGAELSDEVVVERVWKDIV